MQRENSSIKKAAVLERKPRSGSRIGLRAGPNQFVLQSGAEKGHSKNNTARNSAKKIGIDFPQHVTKLIEVSEQAHRNPKTPQNFPNLWNTNLKFVDNTRRILKNRNDQFAEKPICMGKCGPHYFPNLTNGSKGLKIPKKWDQKGGGGWTECIFKRNEKCDYNSSPFLNTFFVSYLHQSIFETKIPQFWCLSSSQLVLLTELWGCELLQAFQVRVSFGRA